MQTIAVYNSRRNPAQHVGHAMGRLITPKRIFFFLILVLLVLFGLYMYYINATVENVVSYGRLEQQADTLSLAVDSLQSQYSNMKSGITLTLAHNEGYQDVNSPQFISLNTAGNGNQGTAAGGISLSYATYR